MKQPNKAKILMQNILLTPVGWMLHLLAWMPWWVIWANADVLYVVAYRLLGYRKKIVRKNLTDSFPDKSPEELHTIERQFYRNFADYFFETVKLLHISDSDMQRHMVFHNVDYIDDGIERGQSVMMYASHLFNWEWITSITLWFRESTRARGNVLGQAYHPLENQWFDRFFLRLRNRYSTCFPSKQILHMMVDKQREGHYMALGFISDQHPMPNDQKHVVKFLNHPTAIITGTEGIARLLDMRVGYFWMRRVSRGHYDCTVIPMCEHARLTPKGQLTDQYAQLLEQNIEEQTPLWLWTHNRWKRPVQYSHQEHKNEETKQ